MEFHPIAQCFPLMEGEEYQALVDDVARHKLREPIVLYEGMILDGRNRYRAWQEAFPDAVPPYVEFEGDDPVGFVISKNLRRRHLTASQRAAAAARLENVSHGGDRSKQDANLHLARKDAAKALNVSPRLVAHAAKVQADGIPALKRGVRVGEFSAEDAAAIVHLPPSRQERAIEVVRQGQAKTLAQAAGVKRERMNYREGPPPEDPAAVAEEAARERQAPATAAVEEMAPVACDDFGTPVPERLATVFRQKHLWLEAEKAARAAHKAAFALEHSASWELGGDKVQYSSKFLTAARRFKVSRPMKLCPTCQGVEASPDAEKCKPCGGLGWLTGEEQ